MAREEVAQLLPCLLNRCQSRVLRRPGLVRKQREWRIGKSPFGGFIAHLTPPRFFCQFAPGGTLGRVAFKKDLFLENRSLFLGAVRNFKNPRERRQ
jgi:hypothetical protein